MLGIIANAIAMLLLAIVLCLGVFGTLAGAVVAAIAAPGDRPVEIPARHAGLLLAALSLFVFAAAAVSLVDMGPHA